MSACLSVRPRAHNAPPIPFAIRTGPAPTPVAALRLGDNIAKLQRAIEAMESRWLSRRGTVRGRHSTRAMARAALVEVAQVVALIGLHLPGSTKRQRDYQRDAINPILEAIDRATGHCPRCSVRVASWAAPAGPLAFVPCASHRKAEGGAL